MEDEWGRARVRQQGVDGVEKLQEAIDCCPVTCIHWVSTGSRQSDTTPPACPFQVQLVTAIHASCFAKFLSLHASRNGSHCCFTALPAPLSVLCQVTAPQLALLEETMSRMERVAAFLLVS
jgi:hypothetical protein